MWSQNKEHFVVADMSIFPGVLNTKLLFKFRGSNKGLLTFTYTQILLELLGYFFYLIQKMFFNGTSLTCLCSRNPMRFLHACHVIWHVQRWSYNLSSVSPNLIVNLTRQSASAVPVCRWCSCLIPACAMPAAEVNQPAKVNTKAKI